MRGKLIAVLFALAVAAFAPSLGVAQYTPKWHVGDWWVTKTWQPAVSGRMRWELQRYDVLGIEKIGKAECLVLQEKTGDTTTSQDGARDLYYVRTDNYRVVRVEAYSPQAGKLQGGRYNIPDGLFGPTPLQPRLPWFPLGSGSVQDSTFRDSRTVAGWAWLRQFSGPADSAVLERFRGEPDSFRGSTVLPGDGKMFFALSELGAPRGPGGTNVPCGYSLQLWSEAYQWRLYEELGQYAPDGARQPDSRSWLVAWGSPGGKQ